MLTSHHDMVWRAQLAILIAFFSGGWTYVKVTAILSCLVLPPDLLSVSRRQWILRVMDALGKWSLIDCFVMFLFTCAFHFQIQPAANLGVFVTVHSQWPYYEFILAALLSLGGWWWCVDD